MNKVDREIVHAYRHLYRGLLHAVQFSSPVRYVARDQLRSAFRERGASWNPEGAKRTLWFLHAAARETGLEHKILKNLLRVRLQQEPVEAPARDGVEPLRNDGGDAEQEHGALPALSSASNFCVARRRPVRGQGRGKNGDGR
ncbi:hypothetical protein DCS_07232 [Drechmeria coniospora]|uniref:Mitochondrial carrier protein n=1 Tax=Drechmeria coniospora TaxID=98403 RepID=A0A151GDU1_DRECN|nr:hypothetical protein DCS_07232 [Drechmeria coniospora]KYK55269.1 hypothetical protein DCS_07232 [Drechmeria coniospora]